MNDQELSAYCLEWARWCRTRRYFAPPVPPNILAQLQPRRRVTADPDGPLDPMMSYFNMAVHGLAEQEPGEHICFTLYYFHGFRPVKAIAAAMGIGNRTFYDRLHRFARRAYQMAATIKRVQLEECAEKSAQ